MNKPGYLIPMIAAGIAAGVMSNMPCLSALNCIFCMWLIVAGAGASFLYLKMGGSYVPSDGEGVTLGLGAGAVAGMVNMAISFLTFYGFGKYQYQAELMKAMDDVPPELREFVSGILEMPGLFLLVGGLVSMGLFMGFGMLGGYLGMRIFKPKMFGPGPGPGVYPPGGGGYPYPPPPGPGPPPGNPPGPGGWSPPPGPG